MSGSNWRDMFEEPQRGGRSAPTAPAQQVTQPELDDEPSVDLTIYRPWLLQRGRSRPAMMLDLRRYEPRSGFWSGWAVAYHQLQSVDYTGEQLVSLDFGDRQFMLEGQGLGELVRYLQLGSVVAIQEFAPMIWPSHSTSVITAIRKV